MAPLWPRFKTYFAPPPGGEGVWGARLLVPDCAEYPFNTVDMKMKCMGPAEFKGAF